MKNSNFKTDELKQLYTRLDEVNEQLQQLQAKNTPVPNSLFETLDSILKEIIACKER